MKTKLLLVEDEIDLADNIKSILELNGFEVLVANNGVEGIILAKQERPDIIVSDISMPKKNGYEVLDELNKDVITSHIPFIFLTARVEHKDLRKGMELGADDYIFKPFHSKELITAINARLERVNAFKGQKLSDYVKSPNRYTKDDSIILGSNKSSGFIKINKISFISAERQYTKVFLTDKKSVVLRKSLLYWESILPGDLFVRIHRTTIVNIQEIEKISKKDDGNYKVNMKDGYTQFEISRRYMKKIRELFFV